MWLDTERPYIKAWPPLFLVKPLSMFMVVVLPAPFCPSKASLKNKNENVFFFFFGFSKYEEKNPTGPTTYSLPSSRVQLAPATATFLRPDL